MAENDLLKRLLDAGMTFTAMTQARAEDLIRDLVRAGEVQAEQAQSVIDELVDRSRRNSERLIDAVRAEIRQQMASLGLATKSDLERLERQVADVSAARGSRKATTKKASARKATKATKATRKSGGRTAAAKKTGAKRTGAKKTAAKKTAAKKTAAKNTAAKKAPARKATRSSKSSKSSSASKATRARSTR